MTTKVEVPIQGTDCAECALYGAIAASRDNFARPILTFFGILFGVVLFVAVVGEWLGFFGTLTKRVPWPIGAAVVLIGGYPVFRAAIVAALKRRITAHALMSVGALEALAFGEWATAAVVVFFMRAGDYAERFTTEHARRAVRDLTALAPQMARVWRGGGHPDQ